MKHLILIVVLLIVSDIYGQEPIQTISMTGTVVSNDSVPISDVAIVNSRTGKTVRTNASGFFKTDMAENDSLFVYHISYKRRFISKKDDDKLIVLEPEIQELKQVNISDESRQEQKNLDATMKDIMRLAPMKTLTGYDLNPREQYFILENGSLNRGFSPYFGPTAHIPLEKITHLFSKSGTKNEGEKPDVTKKSKKEKREETRKSEKTDNRNK